MRYLQKYFRSSGAEIARDNLPALRIAAAASVSQKYPVWLYPLVSWKWQIY